MLCSNRQEGMNKLQGMNKVTSSIIAYLPVFKEFSKQDFSNFTIRAAVLGGSAGPIYTCFADINLEHASLIGLVFSDDLSVAAHGMHVASVVLWPIRQPDLRCSPQMHRYPQNFFVR